MEVEILGIEKVDYTKKDGTHVSGYNINYGTPIDEKFGEGLRVTREYVASSRVQGELKVDSKALVTFGRGFDGQAYLSGVQAL